MARELDHRSFQNTKIAHHIVEVDKLPRDGLAQIVMAGRSNIGKSSLINALCSQKGLARSSSSPGKTRALLFFKVSDAFYLVDLPGYGYAAASKAQIEQFSGLTEEYLQTVDRIAVILLLLDIRHDPSENDVAMLRFLAAQEHPYALILNKTDKLSRAQCEKQIRTLATTLHQLGCADVPLFPVSSLKGDGINELKSFILHTVREFKA